MQTTIATPPDSRQHNTFATQRRYNDRFSVRRDNSQDDFDAPVKKRSTSRQSQAPAVPAKPNFQGPPPGLFNRFFIWACTKLFGRSGH